jgi:hypothetical protein
MALNAQFGMGYESFLHKSQFCAFPAKLAVITPVLFRVTGNADGNRGPATRFLP